jgi:hypothetical protein
MSVLREPNAEPIPGYRLIEPIGSGGFGEAWKCEAPGGLFKAIKFVFGNLNSLDVEGARAEQELHALNRIKEVRHPFVLSLDRIEVVEGELVIVMELADKSLHDVFVECQNAGLIGVPRDDLLRYMRDAAEALDHMNEKHNLQHLDIKPRNLFLVSDRVKVADFGLVKHLERQSGSGVLGGVTPLYAAPETFTNKISGSSDQYSMAIVYMELLTGQRPFNGKNARQLAQQHLHDEPELRSLPEGERAVVARALAKDPSKRFPNCLAFVRGLYTARSVQPPVAIPVAVGAVTGNRPKSLVETLENIHLENVPAEESAALEEVEPEPASVDEEVDLGAPRGDCTFEEVSQLGITIAQPQTGVLRPTLIIGIGSHGRRALLDLRCRIIDRFGDLNKVPLLRFVYVDCDGDAIKSSLRGSSEVALRATEVHHLPLQPVSHYRRRQLEQLNDWLPREKLYALPRSLKTQGSRALGRLAFSDNYLRFLTRLKREIQHAAHPDALYQSVNQTGMALRDSTPRVYVIASAGGGGSGFLVDLGYTLRRTLQQLRHPEAPVHSVLLCGAPEDPATPASELANIYATLTELNHYSDTSIPFAVQYGVDGPRMLDKGAPYDSVYLLTQAYRTPEARRDCLAHLCAYFFHELTTPLGLRLDNGRRLSGGGVTPFRSFGTYSVWFPRGLLLRLAGRSACKQLFEDWQAVGEPTARAEVEAACARILADPTLRPEALAAHIEQTANLGTEGKPGEALTHLLSTCEEPAQLYVAQDDPGGWATQTLVRVQDWLGSGLRSTMQAGEWRKSRLTRCLESAANKSAEEMEHRLSESVFSLTEHPGRRVAAAEAALKRLMNHCDEEAAKQVKRVEQIRARVQQAQTLLQKALQDCMNSTGSFSLFGGRSKRVLRVFLDHLAAFARQCLEEDLTTATRQFLSALRGRLGDRLGDLSLCRQRLRGLQEILDLPLTAADELSETPALSDVTPTPSSSGLPSAESFWESIRQSATTRVVLPEVDPDLEQAAERFLRTLKPEHWTQLDQALQETVLAPLGGLHRCCMKTGDLARFLLCPLLEQAAVHLGNHLPITDVAQVEEMSASCKENALSYYANATPLISAQEEGTSVAYLLVPGSDAGKSYGEKTRRVVQGLQVLKVAGQADLMFCREQGFLSVEDLERIFRSCRTAYEETAVVVNASPHARFDVTDWIPLEP